MTTFLLKKTSQRGEGSGLRQKLARLQYKAKLQEHITLAVMRIRGNKGPALRPFTTGQADIGPKAPLAAWLVDIAARCRVAMASGVSASARSCGVTERKERAA